MKIAIIGANGNLGSRVTRQALERGHSVRGYIYAGDSPDERAEIVCKSVFDITREELEGFDAMISAYGSGFQADPALNRMAFIKYIELNENSPRHMISIGGAGSLFKDHTHTTYCYEAPEHPEFLREISRNIKLGIDELMKTDTLNWTVVCPSSFFDLEGGLTGRYRIGTEEHLIFNNEGKSIVTYDDLAMAMVDIAEQNSYQRQKLVVLTE